MSQLRQPIRSEWMQAEERARSWTHARSRPEEVTAAEGPMSHVRQPIGSESMHAEERARASERARGRLEEFTGALESRAGEMLGDAEMAARGKERELRGQLRQQSNR